MSDGCGEEGGEPACRDVCSVQSCHLVEVRSVAAESRPSTAGNKERRQSQLCIAQNNKYSMNFPIDRFPVELRGRLPSCIEVG